MAIHFKGRLKPHGKYKIRQLLSNAPPVIASPPAWDTPSGLIGAWSEGDAIDFALIASDPNGDIKSYALQDGTLPDGVTVNAITGHLLGTIGQVGQDTTYTFTVRVVDRTNLFADRVFNLLVKDKGTQVTWVTPSGTVGQGSSGQDYQGRVMANSNG